MRVIPIAVVLALVACGSFDPATSPASDGGGPTGDAAASEAGIDGGGTGAKSCAERNANADTIVCEDFEGADPFAGWTLNQNAGGKVVPAPDPTRGSNVMRTVLIPSAAAEDAQIIMPLARIQRVYVRFFMRLDAPLPDANYHILAVLTDIDMGLEGGKLLINRYGADSFYETSDIPFPLQKWACVEWMVDANRTTLSVDGALHKVVDGTPNELAERFIVGIRHLNPTTGPSTVSFDDLVVSKQPIGCD